MVVRPLANGVVSGKHEPGAREIVRPFDPLDPASGLGRAATAGSAGRSPVDSHRGRGASGLGARAVRGVRRIDVGRDDERPAPDRDRGAGAIGGHTAAMRALHDGARPRVGDIRGVDRGSRRQPVAREHRRDEADAPRLRHLHDRRRPWRRGGARHLRNARRCLERRERRLGLEHARWRPLPIASAARCRPARSARGDRRPPCSIATIAGGCCRCRSSGGSRPSPLWTRSIARCHLPCSRTK